MAVVWIKAFRIHGDLSLMKTKNCNYKYVKFSMLLRFEPGSPACNTGIITTTPQQHVYTCRSNDVEYVTFNINGVFILVAIIAIIVRSLKFLCIQYLWPKQDAVWINFDSVCDTVCKLKYPVNIRWRYLKLLYSAEAWCERTTALASRNSKNSLKINSINDVC